jgi:hypothetical protein
MFLVSFPLVLLVQREITNLGFLPRFSWCSLFHRICLVEFLLPRNPPTEEELRKIKRAIGTLHHLLIYFLQLRHAKSMWQLALVYLFQWYALFCYWQNSSKSITLSVWNTPQKMKLYGEAVSWTGLVNGYNIVTLCAFGLVYFAKYSPKMVHSLFIVGSWFFNISTY